MSDTKPSYEQLEKWLCQAMDDHINYGNPSDALEAWFRAKRAELHEARKVIAREALTALTDEQVEALGLDRKRFQ